MTKQSKTIRVTNDVLEANTPTQVADLIEGIAAMAGVTIEYVDEPTTRNHAPYGPLDKQTR